MMAKKTAILFLAFFANLLCPSTGDFVLRIAHTNDVHARFENTSSSGGTCRGNEEDGCYGGVARRYTIMEILRQQAGSNLLFLDAGDQFQGTLWFIYYQGNATSHFMNLLQYDVMALGNHEFDNGVEGLRPFLQSVNFSVISANIDSSNEPLIDGLFAPSVIKVIDGQKIGIVGYTTKDTPQLVLPSGVENLKFNDEITKVQEEVTRLRDEEGVNKIIALGHAGYNLDKELAAAVDGVDIVVGGHTDTFLYTGTPPSTEVPAGEYPTIITQASGAEVLVVQEYTFGKYLGYLEVTFNEVGEVISWKGNPILLNDSYEEDPDIAAEIEIWKEPIFNLTQEVVGTSAVFLDGSKPSCRNYECNMGNMITDAMIFYFLELFGSTSSSWTNTSIAFWNGGGIRAPIAQGEFTMEDVLTTLPYGNMVEKVEITGQTLLEVLAHSISNYDPTDSPGAFLQMSGLRVQYDLSTSPKKVVEVQVRCAACVSPSYAKLEPDGVYAVLTSNFLIDGGDGFEVLRDNVISRLPYDTVLSDIVVEYARQQSIIYAQTESRITFVDSTVLTCGSSSLCSFFNPLTPFLVFSMIWIY